MYVGHFAAGFALKAVEPRAKLSTLLLGVCLLDFFFCAFVLLGLERLSPAPEFTPGFQLDFIDWSHSLLSAVVGGVVFGALFFRRGARIAVVYGLSVFSHFLVDLPMHPGDLAAYPHSELHFGWGFWRSMPIGWWFVELALIIAAWFAYQRRGRAEGTFAGKPLGVLALMLGLHIGFSPWIQPLLR